jgi:pilus assembly protein Flp/PilA
MIDMLKNLHKEESGQDLIEYALLAALIAVVSIAVLGTIGTKVNSEFTKVSGALT